MTGERKPITAERSEPTLEKDAEKAEYLLKLTTDRVTGLEGALEKNWIAHLVLAATGLALVFQIGSFRDLLSNYFIHGSYDQKVIAAVDLALLLYYFMKLGHLLTLYVEGNELRKQLQDVYLGKYLDKHFTTANAVLGKSTNFYVEAFFSIRSPRIRHLFWPYMLVTTIVVSLAQAAALFLVARAFGWLSIILIFGCVVIVALYYIFWSSNKNSQPQTTVPVVVSTAMVVGWLLVFHLTSR